jgi:hypothetical protein
MRECSPSRDFKFCKLDTLNPPEFGLPLVKGGGYDEHLTADNTDGNAKFMPLMDLYNLHFGKSLFFHDSLKATDFSTF